MNRTGRFERSVACGTVYRTSCGRPCHAGCERKREGNCDGNREGKRAMKRRHTVRGFTLIELLVAIAILAVIAVLSWRGLDQIIRGRQTITNAMEDERVFA